MTKRITLILIVILLLCAAISAQQAAKQEPPKQIHAEVIKMAAEYAAQLKEVEEKSSKLARDNAQLVSAWQQYVSQQKDLQAEVTRIILRAALAAKMTVEQLDNSDLKVDGKGNYEWVPRDTSKPSAQRSLP